MEPFRAIALSNYGVKPSKNHLILHFDSWTLAKGEDYKNRQKVLQWTIEPSNSSDSSNSSGATANSGRSSVESGVRLEATVSGTGGQAYRSRILLRHDKAAVQFANCSCPVREDCKHAAALLLTYLESGAFLESDGDAANDHESGVSRAVRRGLESIARVYGENAESNSSPRASSSQTFKKTADSYKPRTALIYVIEQNVRSTRPAVAMRSMSILRDGGYGLETKFAIERLLESQPPSYASPEDIEIARLWQAVESHGSDNFYYSHATRKINPDLFAVLFERVLKSGRCFLQGQYKTPLHLGEKLSGHVVWQEFLETQFRLEFQARNPNKKNLQCLRWNSPWYIDTETMACGPVSVDLKTETIDEILAMPAVSQKDAVMLSLSLNQLGLEKIIPAPPGAHPVEVQLVCPAPKLQSRTLRSLRPIIDKDRVLAVAGEKVRVVSFSSDIAGGANVTSPHKLENGLIVLERFDSQGFESMGDVLKAKGFIEIDREILETDEGEEEARYFVQSTPQSWLNLDSTAIGELRQSGWEISEATETLLRPVALDFDDVQIEVLENKNWWFSIALNIDVGGKKVALLPVLLSAIRGLAAKGNIADSIEQLNYKGKFVANLEDGGVISLPFDRIRSILLSLEELFRGRSYKNAAEISVLHAAQLLSETGLSTENWIGGAKILSLVDRLKRLEKIEIVQPPKKFGTELRAYQLEGVSWLQFLASQNFGGILADDMGLGKTVQLLAHICLEKEKKKLKQPFLVVCPTSVLPNWISECEKFAPHLKLVSFHGSRRASSLRELAAFDIVVTTYPILHRDIEELLQIEWHGIALDEAQAIKNHSTKLAQAARSLKAGHRFCLTGTPVENHLGELWSQFQFALPGILGDQNRFRDIFRNPIERENNLERKRTLAARIRPFMLRRTKQEVAKDLPEKIQIEQCIEIGGAQRDLYETVRLASTRQLKKEIAKKGFKHSQILILDALLKLRQVCCDPRLVKLSAAQSVGHSAKLEELLNMLEQLRQEDRKVLVFSQFTSMLAIIAEELAERAFKFVTITGATKDRKSPVEDFQNGNAQVFLISLKAGGTGLNLTAADVVIHYDPWWNPAAEAQATDRAHRIGQNKTVFVYKLIAQGTIEQKMIELQKRKSDLANSIYADDGNTSLSFNESDLEQLLAPLD